MILSSFPKLGLNTPDSFLVMKEVEAVSLMVNRHEMAARTSCTRGHDVQGVHTIHGAYGYEKIGDILNQFFRERGVAHGRGE